MHLQKQRGIRFFQTPFFKIIQSDIGPVGGHELFQNRRLTNLTRAGDQYTGILLGQRNDSFFDIPFDMATNRHTLLADNSSNHFCRMWN